MSYRQSNYDPNAYEQQGAPLRPFNWVQWVGVAFAVAGIAVDLLYFAGRFGWVRPMIDSPSPALALILPAILLINSRRGPVTLVGSEQLERNRRVLLITVAILVALFGAILVIELSGA